MMIKQFAFMDPTGVFPLQLGSNFHVPEGALELEGDAADYATCMRIGGLWEQRPSLTAPVIDGQHLRFEGVPLGTAWDLTDVGYGVAYAGEVAAEGLLEFDIASAGDYQIILTPPLPWLVATFRVEIQ